MTNNKKVNQFNKINFSASFMHRPVIIKLLKLFWRFFLFLGDIEYQKNYI